MIGSLLSKLRTAAQIIFALSVLLSAQAQGVTATASGTYTWNSTTSVIAWNFTSSTFTCDGPNLGSDTSTGVTITATTMTWSNDSPRTWTRLGGTAGDIVGTWTATGSTTGNSFTLVFDANGTASVVGNIVLCSAGNGSGSNGVKAEAHHWSGRYYVQLQYSDAYGTATSVTVTGHGITGSVALTHNTHGSWGSGTPESIISFGSTYPAGLPFSYTFSVTDATGTWTAPSTVSCFQQQFVTNISPAGNVYGTPTFNWTGISDPSAIYGVQVNDGNGNWLWANYYISGSSIAYNGPALTSGMTYSYVVSLQGSSACNYQTSGGSSSSVAGSFTYVASGGDTSPPTVPTGVNATAASPTQINLSWTASTDNIGVTGYKVYRNGVLAGSPAGTGYSDTGLAASTAYSYTVAACDAAGNCSAQSGAVNAQTPAPIAPIAPATPLPPPPATQTVFTVPVGQMPTAAVSVSPSGTFGNATLVVTLDLSRVLAGGAFAGLGQFAAGYSIYVAALVPGGVLGLPSATWFVLPATHSWALLSIPIAAYMEGLAQNATNSVTISIVQGMDISQLTGTELYVGYGTSSEEMLAAGRYRGFYKAQ